MIRVSTAAVAAAMLMGLAIGGGAQAQQEPGARAGNAYVPSTHTPGCGGIMCDGNDPERAPGAPPPPPCQGLLCSVSPYAMRRPITASEAKQMQEEQARAAAAAPAPAEPSAKSPRKHRTKKSAKKAASQKTAAARTPDPGTSAPEAK